MDIHSLVGIKIQDVVIEFRNHVIFHDWAHFRGRALPLKSGGCKILRWWGYHHQIWSNDKWIWMMIWWGGHHHQIWSDGACYALEKRRYHLFPQEWICDFLIALNKLSIFIYEKSATQFLLFFQELSKCDLLHRGTPSKWFMVRSSQEPF